MNVSIRYDSIGLPCRDASDRGKIVQYPSMDISINNQMLRIIKAGPFNHQDHSGSCDTSIRVVLVTSEETYKVLDLELGQIVREKTCDRNFGVPGNWSNQLNCCPQGAHQALDTVIRTSTVFSKTQYLWLAKAKAFIDQQAPTERLDPNLECFILSALRQQEGAMNLLTDLKNKPFTSDISKILQRLLSGVYGDFSSQEDSPTTTLATDLERGGFTDLAKLVSQGRYEHSGPDESKHVAEALASIAQQATQT